MVQGETAEESAHRELEEETGISDGNWSYLGRYVEADTIYEGFVCVMDWPKNRIRLQPL